MKKHALVLMFLVAACLAPRAQALTYSIDGSLDDWGVNLETDYYYSYFSSGVYFLQSSFTPDPIGTIRYNVEDYPLSDYRPDGGEYYDYEAAYLDTSPGWIYVAIVASHPWDPPNTELNVTVNGITVQAEDFDYFASADLGISERVGGDWYSNYVYEGAVSLAQFGNPAPDTNVSVYANCCFPCQPPDYITICGKTPPSGGHGPVIPEPSSIALVGMALTALVGRKWRRRRAAA